MHFDWYVEEPKGIQTAVEMILANDGDKGNHLREAPEVPLKVRCMPFSCLQIDASKCKL